HLSAQPAPLGQGEGLHRLLRGAHRPEAVLGPHGIHRRTRSAPVAPIAGAVAPGRCTPPYRERTLRPGQGRALRAVIPWSRLPRLAVESGAGLVPEHAGDAVRIRTWLLCAFALLSSCWAGHVSAATTVEVLEVHPAGRTVTLGRGERFCLRLAYASDTPAGIWIAPYYRGKRVNAGTSPSVRHTGRGETIAWFFFMEPGGQVDEIRIRAGDGGINTTPVVATYPVHVVGGSGHARAQAPAWVTELDARAKAAQRQAIETYRSQPTSIGDKIGRAHV